ncbi:hypothetical protein CLU79DRAFT_818532 [Phycomyces nitens]|nr:hypothetical protein CLU79DRAFT_818532 [Phycomyces nitens]
MTEPAKRNGRLTLGRNAMSMGSLKTPPSLRSIARLGSSFGQMSLSPSSSTTTIQDDDSMLQDILNVRTALDLFLDSRIPEAEAILSPNRKTSMYYSLGHAFILFLKSMMTFQQSDIQVALDALKDTVQLANGLRRKDGSWLAWVKGNSVNDIKDMSRIHRHAELVYAESYLLKALLSILNDESLVSFLREGLHVRNSYNTYKILEKYVDFVNKEAEQGKDVSAYGLDDHFTSGVALGVGCFNIMLSMLPTSVLRVVEFIGFSSDRAHGLSMLESIGGWEEFRDTEGLPAPQAKDEGLRRQFCDMVLMAYHIMLSKVVPLQDADPEIAAKVLAYNLGLYPAGVFFLFFSGRQLSSLGKFEDAKDQYRRAIDTQKDWKQLQHMCYWELGLLHLMQHQWQESAKVYAMLTIESNWSKAVYTYLEATALHLYVQSQSRSDPAIVKKVESMMRSVDGAKQKIAGKSIPLEKFVARKARKFTAQNNYLALPDLELLSALGVLESMPSDVLRSNINRTNRLIESLQPKQDDDMCLAHYLRAQLTRLLIKHSPDSSRQTLEQNHKASIDAVMQHAPQVQFDHYIYYFTRYENARMLISQQLYSEAEAEIQGILRTSEKRNYNMGATSRAKSKYSLESMLLFKCHNCLAEIKALDEDSSSDFEDAVQDL